MAQVNGNHHWFWFLDYVTWELAAGGPDPQIRTTSQALRAFDDETAVLLAGAFVNSYTCAGAAAQWNWLLRGLDLSPKWIDEHWGEGLPIRKERRAVKGRQRFFEAWQSWRRWCEVDWPVVRHLGPEQFEDVWNSIDGMTWGFGRYALMKTTETLYQRGLLATRMVDMRPDGAKYPRKTLARLFPGHAEALQQVPKLSDPIAQDLAQVTKAWLEECGVDLNWYQLETVLCTYRQACGQNKYPGRSQDRELMFFRTAEDYWARWETNLLEHFSFYTVRRQVFDPLWLGEVNGWNGPRKELEDLWVARYPEGVAY
jgi:hypothetical protein